MAMTRSPQGSPALVLNADYQPLSYFPLSLWPWQEAVKAVFLDRVDIVSEYERWISSPSLRMRLPSVVSLKRYVQPAHRPAFTRFNVFLRDSFTCQYCGGDGDGDLTFDHLVPRSQGGRTRWSNVVAACSRCNLRKGGRRPEQAGMYPRAMPVEPSMFRLRQIGRRFPPNHLHESWRDYLYWDAELEP